MLSELDKQDLELIEGGFVISTGTLIICAVSSFLLGGVCGAGIYVGYKSAGK